MKHRIVVFLLILLISCSASLWAAELVESDPLVHGTRSDNSDFSESQTYKTRDAIALYSNADFHSQAIAENWPGDGSEDSPYIISGYNLTSSSTQPIRLWDVDLFWEFRDNLIESPSRISGTYFVRASNGLIANNVFRNRFTGMLLEDCTDLTVFGNSVVDNAGNGIEVVGSAFRCKFLNNTIQWSGAYGFVLPFTIDSLVQYNTIMSSVGSAIGGQGMNRTLTINNIISDNGLDGILLAFSDSCTVSMNTIQNSSRYGIYVLSGDNNSLTRNQIEESSDYGLRLGALSSMTTIRQNTFVSNGGTCQAYDNGENNTFIYNYYADWVNPDIDANHIVDEPYKVEGDALNEDPYPLVGPDATIPNQYPTTYPDTPTGFNLDPLMIVGITGSAIVFAVAVFLKRS
ncbi:MAG: right-handed parallel beta-helix repeat-containing protein [Candidatus Thorarchaeota archaeon]